MKAKRVISRIFLGIVVAINATAMLLMLTLWLGSSSVLYWLMDTTYGVFEIVGLGAILGISFGFDTQNYTKFKKHLRAQMLSRIRHTQILAKFAPAVKHKRG